MASVGRDGEAANAKARNKPVRTDFLNMLMRLPPPVDLLIVQRLHPPCHFQMFRKYCD
jgi:hypothetical protein